LQVSPTTSRHTCLFQPAKVELSLDNIAKVTLATLNQRGFLNVDTTDPNNKDGGVYNYKPGDDN